MHLHCMQADWKGLCALSKPPTYYIPCTTLTSSTIVTLRFGPSGGLQMHWSERGLSLMLNISSDSLIESRTIVTLQVASLLPAAKQHSEGCSTSVLPVHKKVQNRSHTHAHAHTYIRTTGKLQHKVAYFHSFIKYMLKAYCKWCKIETVLFMSTKEESLIYTSKREHSSIRQRHTSWVSTYRQYTVAYKLRSSRLLRNMQVQSTHMPVLRDKASII